METLFAKRALLADGWADDVGIDIDDGRIAAIRKSADDRADDRADGRAATRCGIVIPGVCNAHSHAFQRALAGHTEHAARDSADTFWTWRDLMYRLATRMTPELLRDIAAELYAEMLASGYTSVVEFHYLLGGRQKGASPRDYLDALLAAAEQSGIRLVYLPVLYERAGFDDDRPTAAQASFALDVDAYLAHCQDAGTRVGGRHRLGVGAHSLRAVSAESLLSIDRYSSEHGLPMHIHLAEQRREVDDCRRVLGTTPVRWLLDHAGVDERWTAVHATHMDDAELDGLAKSGAVACVCPSTEANLGDGLFRLRDYLNAGGTLAIGSDSHVSINPYEELRWMEYGQRLIAEQRNVAAIGGRHTGAGLYRRAVEGGARASGVASAELRVNGPADLVALDDDNPMLTGHAPETLIDALVFSGFSLPIDRVMVAGRWCINEGLHPRRNELAANYRLAVADLDLARVVHA